MSIAAIIDIVFVAILIILAVIGLTKGFLKSAIAMVGTCLSALIAYFAAQPVGSLVNMIFKSTKFFAGKLTTWLHSISEFFSITRNGESFSTLAGEMTTGGVDGAVQKLANVVLGSSNIPAGQSVGQVIGDALGALITTLIGGLVAFILIRVIIKILERLASKITQVRIFGVIDKLLGFIFGLAKGLLYCAIAFAMMSILTYVKPIDNKLTPIMDRTTVAQKYYDWIDYNVQDFLNENFFKKKPGTPTPTGATEKSLEEMALLLPEIGRAYVDQDNSKVYLLTGTAEITDPTNIATLAKYYVKYSNETELFNIMTVIDFYALAEGKTITIDNRPTITMAEEVEMTFLTDDNLETISYVYIDWEFEYAYFKIDNSAPIDVENLAIDCDYCINFSTITDGGNQIKTAIETYNTNNGASIVVTESEPVV